jgi:hypothetical protein
MDKEQIEKIIELANEEFAVSPENFQEPRLIQPASQWMKQAQDQLGEDAPLHQVVRLAQALSEEEQEVVG